MCLAEIDSVRRYTKVSPYMEGNVFVFLSICASHESDCRNNPISLKFGTIVYVLCEIRCIVFGVHCPNSTYAGIHKVSQYVKERKEILVSAF